MKSVVSLSELREERKKIPGPVGLVPTMGYLHAGHLSLVRQAGEQCASVVVSIFLNPTQFGPQEDLAAYPRDLARDLEMLEEGGADLVWIPTPEIMYPPGYQTWVTVADVTKPLEGSLRPNHFRGVATVVTKLFNSVQPDKAFFGQKDAQQALVMQCMVQDLNFPIEVVVCPTVREADGLAMSSRNVYLNPEERRAAASLYKSLQTARQAYENGERSAGRLRQAALDILAQEPLAQPQYVSCAEADSLQELDWVEGPALLSMAVFIGKTRLIDNIILGR
jgi:pantoate--beta-alanine ligase